MPEAKSAVPASNTVPAPETLERDRDPHTHKQSVADRSVKSVPPSEKSRTNYAGGNRDLLGACGSAVEVEAMEEAEAAEEETEADATWKPRRQATQPSNPAKPPSQATQPSHPAQPSDLSTDLLPLDEGDVLISERVD